MDARSTDSAMDSAAESIHLVAKRWMSCELTEEWRRRLAGLGMQEELRTRWIGGVGLRDEEGRFRLELEAAEARVLAICNELSE